MKKTIVVLTLAMAFCFALASMAQATDTAEGRKWAKKNLRNRQKATSIPIWQITKDGTANSVVWVNATNPRFAIYDPSTPGDQTDDVVLDKETGLVWERYPHSVHSSWSDACASCYNLELAGRKGWRLPSVEELTSLVDMNGDGTGCKLPSGHPFIIYPGPFFSKNKVEDPFTGGVWLLELGWGVVIPVPEGGNEAVWCVRGGQGHDAP